MEYIKNNIRIEIQKQELNKERVQRLLDNSVPKIFFKYNTELSYKETPFEDTLLRKKFPGQTYISIPFTYSFNENGNIALEVTNDNSAIKGICKVSKRDIREQYGMYKASKENVLEKAYIVVKYTLDKLSNLLNGNEFDIKIAPLYNGEEKYHIANVITNGETFYNEVITNILPIDLDTRTALQAFIGSDEFEIMFNTNNTKAIFE